MSESNVPFSVAPGSLEFWVQAGIALGISFISGVSKGMTGFGSAILFVTIWSLIPKSYDPSWVGDLELSSAILFLNSVALNTFFAAVGLRKESTQLDLVAAIFISAQPAVYLGAFVLVSVETVILKQSLGAFLVLACFVQWAQAQTETSAKVIKPQTGNKGIELACNADKPPEDASPPSEQSKSATWCARLLRSLRSRRFWSGCAAGAIYGFLTGSFGTGGPPLMILFVFLNLKKTSVRTIPCLVQLMSLPVHGFSFLQHGILKAEHWHFYVFSILGSFSGGFLGSALHNKVDDKTIHFILRMFVVAGAGTLAGVENDTTLGYVVLGCSICVGLLLAGSKVYSSSCCFHTKQHVISISEPTSEGQNVEEHFFTNLQGIDGLQKQPKEYLGGAAETLRPES